MAASTRREFKLAKSAIPMLIQSQAGSLQKAILEGVANALDAGATQVKIKLMPNQVVIEDDGRGFTSEEELEEFFATFAFDHSQLNRQVGRFGVGRGQMFHFGKNTWTTNGFQMKVDSRNDPYGYDLAKAPKSHKGAKIQIDLYDSLSLSDLQTVNLELRNLVKYCTIPVLLNGKKANIDPAGLTWDVETDDAWIRLDSSHQIKVYSQGLFVQNLGSYQFGKGGLVITKPGHGLKQNMARNDVLANDCEVWKRVKARVSKLAQEHKGTAKRTGTMDNAMRASLAKQVLAGETRKDVEDLLNVALFSLTNGKHVRLVTLFSTKFLSCAKDKDPAADVFMQRKQAAVVSQETLRRFGVDSPTDLAAILKETLARMQRAVQNGPTDPEKWSLIGQIQTATKAVRKCKAVDDINDLPMKANTQVVELQDKELTEDEKKVLSLLRKAMYEGLGRHVARRVQGDAYVHDYNDRHERKVKMAVSEAFAACTDGATTIWMSRMFVRESIKRGLSGFQALTNVLIHELVHTNDTSTGHGHDHEFYHAFHDLTVHGETAAFAINAYQAWLKLGGKASQYNLKQAEKAGMVDEDITTGRLSALAGGSEEETSDAGMETTSGQPEGVKATGAKTKRRRGP